MKKLATILIFISINSFATDYQKDKIDYFVHGQPLNDSLKTINVFMCFIKKGMLGGSLVNAGPYNVLTDSVGCNNSFEQDKDQKGSGGGESQDGTEVEVTETQYNTAIFDVKASVGNPFTAKIWSEINIGSTDSRFLPTNVYYDYSISRLPCSALDDNVTPNPGVNCSKYGNLKLDFTYTPSVDNWSTIQPAFAHLGLDEKDKTVGLGMIEIQDNTINYKAHAGTNTFNLNLQADGNVVKGIFERFISPTANTPAWQLGYMFYADDVKNFYCKKYKYAKILIYKFPFPTTPAGIINPTAEAYDFMSPGNKWGPKAIDNYQDYITISPVTNATEYWKTNIITSNPFEYEEICYSTEKTNALRLVTEYGLYDSEGSRIELLNKPHTISAIASGANDFPGGKMYVYASEYGVYMPHRYRAHFTPEVTVWKNNDPTASASEKAKQYTLKQNFIQADKVTLSYISLDDVHKQSIRMWFYDEHWNTEFKNLGFCGIDNLDKDGNACTSYREYEGYYDKDLENDGNPATKGGFVFTHGMSCNNGPCVETALDKKFENSQWLSIMVKGTAPHTYTRHLHAWNRDARSHLAISVNTLQNPSSNSSVNGIKVEKNEQVAVEDLPATLFCLERCLSPTALNNTYDELIAAGILIADPENDQSWLKTSISGNVDRTATSSPYFDVGPYIKASEVNGSGQLEYDRNAPFGTPEWTRSDAEGQWQDGILGGGTGNGDDGKVVQYNQAGGVLSVNGQALTFDAANVAKLQQIQDMFGLLNGSRVLVQPNNSIETGAYWGFGMGRLFDAAGLAQATCEKTFQVYDSSNADEYDYRPGWSQADNLASPRYCVNKVHSGGVSSWYNIRLVSQPNYDLIDPDTGKRKIFDKPIELDFTVPSTAAYPASEHGKKLKLNYFGKGTRLQGIPMEFKDITTGLPWDGTAANMAYIRGLDKFEIAAGTEVTGTDSLGNVTTYKLKPLLGHAYLKPIQKSAALALIGSGVTEIPYDTTISISDRSVLRDVSPNGTAENTIGVKPTSNVINGGNPCVVDGIHNATDVACAKTLTQ